MGLIVQYLLYRSCGQGMNLALCISGGMSNITQIFALGVN